MTQEAAKASLRRAKSSPPAFKVSAAEQLPPHKPKEKRSVTAVGQVPMKSLHTQHEKTSAGVPALTKLLTDVPHLQRCEWATSIYIFADLALRGFYVLANIFPTHGHCNKSEACAAMLTCIANVTTGQLLTLR